MKFFYVIGIIILVIMLALTGPTNYKPKNLGLENGINGFFAGGIMNVISICLIVFALFMFLKKKNVKIPNEFIPINESSNGQTQ